MGIDYFASNRANWDQRAVLHAARDGSGYGVQRFIDNPEELSEVVQFDLPRLGDITGLRTVHLQCHIGTDTISLARLGADVTGLDFSERSSTRRGALPQRPDRMSGLFTQTYMMQ